LQTRWGNVACRYKQIGCWLTHVSHAFFLFDSLQVDPEQAKLANEDESSEEKDESTEEENDESTEEDKDESTEEEDNDESTEEEEKDDSTDEDELESPEKAASKRNFSDLLQDDYIKLDGDAAFFDDTDADQGESKEEEEEELEPKSPGNTAHVSTSKANYSGLLLDDDIQSDDEDVDFFEDDGDEAIAAPAAIGNKMEADEKEEMAEFKAETKGKGRKENRKGDASKGPEDTKKEEGNSKAKNGKKSKKSNCAKEKAPPIIDETPDWLVKVIDDDNEVRVFAKKYTKDMERDHTFSHSLSDTFLGNLEKTVHRVHANQLFKLLNRDPLSKSNNYSDDTVTTFLMRHPEVCSVKYPFEAFNEPIYPLSMLCTLRPSAYAVQLCFEAHEDAIDTTDTFVGAPLHYACAFGASEDVVDYLTMNENDCVRFINNRRQIPLHLACGSQSSKEVAALLIADDPMTLEIADEECMMPLHLACDNGAELELVQELIPEYPLACIAQTNYGATPLHIAVARRAPLSVLKVLVKGHDAALKVVDNWGRTPLHIAVLLEADFKTMKLLSKKKAFKIKNNMGLTSFEVAETMADASFTEDVMKLLKIGKSE
jgi:hypothetical protein